MMTNARQFVYQYDDKNEPEEIVIDMRGEQEVPVQGLHHHPLRAPVESHPHRHQRKAQPPTARSPSTSSP